MIRPATNGDVPRIVELGSLSLEVGPYNGIIKDNPEKTAGLALQLIHGGGKVFVSEENGAITGVFGMLIVSHPFSGVLTADEVIWFVHPDARRGGDGIKLLWQAEQTAREMGVKDFQVSSPDEKIGALYERFGFKKLETKYLKKL